MITIIIIIITSLISIAAFNNSALFSKLQFNAYQVYYRKEWHRLITHGFIHANWNHLIFNMISFFFFGRYIENYFNSKFIYILFYLSAIIIASTTTLFKHKDNHWYNSVGASGGVSAIIFANILFNPFSGIYIIPIPFPIPAVIYGIIFIIYSQFMSKRYADNINHDAHLLGAVYGLLFPILLDPGIAKSFLDKIMNFIS
ncbi:MAG: rhomboid family intramembrane serine protease [Bacteroidales bacterium]|nr:rhomboid family intramembrane serine protease [Bacteroidales bacterium]